MGGFVRHARQTKVGSSRERRELIYVRGWDPLEKGWPGVSASDGPPTTEECGLVRMRQNSAEVSRLALRLRSGDIGLSCPVTHPCVMQHLVIALQA
jgi:hypothetical protein